MHWCVRYKGTCVYVCMGQSVGKKVVYECECVFLFDPFQDKNDLRSLFSPHRVNHGGVKKPPPQVSLYKSHILL